MSRPDRQRIERVPGSRRAKLTPAPGTTGEPTKGDESAASGADAPDTDSGPNDERMRREKPPHW